eukprot:m51a1_g14735 hypothetical protein (304) ;mRNA; f:237871-239031
MSTRLSAALVALVALAALVEASRYDNSYPKNRPWRCDGENSTHKRKYYANGHGDFTCLRINIDVLSQTAADAAANTPGGKRNALAASEGSSSSWSSSSEYNEDTRPGDIHKAAFFYPRVDQFSALRINGTKWLLPNASKVWVSAQIGPNITAPPILFVERNEEQGDWKIAGFASLVIILDHGEVVDLLWDGKNCKMCGNSRCLGNTSCYTNSSDISGGGCFGEGYNKGSASATEDTTSSQPTFTCEVKLYVAWQGRTYNSHDCTSVGKLPSRFQQYALVGSVYDYVSGLGGDFISNWGTDAND